MGKIFGDFLKKKKEFDKSFDIIEAFREVYEPDAEKKEKSTFMKPFKGFFQEEEKSKLMYQDLYIDGKTVRVSSYELLSPFELNPMDIEFIEQDIMECGASNGELEVILNEGLFTVKYEVINDGTEL